MKKKPGEKIKSNYDGRKHQIFTYARRKARGLKYGGKKMKITRAYQRVDNKPLAVGKQNCFIAVLRIRFRASASSGQKGEEKLLFLPFLLF